MVDQYNIRLNYLGDGLVVCIYPLARSNLKNRQKGQTYLKRMILDDGLCIFDITLANDDLTDEASGYDFRRAANNLIRNCATTGGEPEGGIATGIGTRTFCGATFPDFH